MNAVANEKALSPIENLRRELTAAGDQFKAVLPPHVTVERFSRVVLTAISGKPDLMAMDRKALFTACLECAKDGLLPDGKEAALVPFKGKPKYMPMVRGVIKTIRNSGELSTILANCVFEKDKYRYWVDSTGEHIEHEPQVFGDRGKMIGVYALATLKDGSVSIEPLSMSDIEKVRNVSMAKNAGPWTDWYEEMAKKTAIRRLSKKLPMSSDVERVIQRDDDMYDLDGREAAADKGKEITQAIQAAQAPEVAEEDVPESFTNFEPGSTG